MFGMPHNYCSPAPPRRAESSESVRHIQSPFFWAVCGIPTRGLLRVLQKNHFDSCTERYSFVLSHSVPGLTAFDQWIIPQGDSLHSLSITYIKESLVSCINVTLSVRWNLHIPRNGRLWCALGDTDTLLYPSSPTKVYPWLLYQVLGVFHD